MKKWICLILTLALLLVARPVGADEVDYRISSYEGELVITTDNQAQFTQTITFDYDSSYRGQVVTLGAAGQAPPGFAIQSQPRVTAKRQGQEVPVRVEEKALVDGYELRVYNAGSAGDQVSLKVVWQLSNLLWVYEDVAVLNWLPITDWQVPLEQVRFRIRTQEPAQDKQLAVHRGLFAPESVIEVEGQDFLVTSQQVEGALEFHAYWERSILSPTLQGSGLGKPDYLAKEAAIVADEAAILKRLQFWLPLGMVGAGSLSLLTFLMVNKRVSGFRAHPKRVYALPEDLPPLLVAKQVYGLALDDFLMPSSVGSASDLEVSNLIQATLLDLLDRRHLALLRQEEGAILQRQDRADLADFERSFLDLVFGEEEQVAVTALFEAYRFDEDYQKKLKRHYQGHELEGAIRRHAKSHLTDLKEAIGRVSHQVELALERLPVLYRPLMMGNHLSFLTSLFLGLVALVLALIGFGTGLTYNLSPYPLMYALGGGLLLVGLLFKVLPRYHRVTLLGQPKRDARETLAAWAGFRQMIKDIQTFDRVDLEGHVVWNRLLVYATLYGQAQRVEDYLRIHQISLPASTGLSLSLMDQHLMHQTLHRNVVVSQGQAQAASQFTLPSRSSSSVGGSGGFSGGFGGGGGGSF